MSSEEAEALTRAGIAALRGGNPQAARAQFERLEAEGGSAPWLLLAQSCRLMGDAAGEEAALKRLLAADTRNLPALLAMGELKARQGDDRAASSFFRTALNQASVMPQVPVQLHPLLDRAQAFFQRVQGQFEAHMLAQLEEAGLGTGQRPPRIAEAIDLLLGKVPLYQQQPSMFYFPGLPQRAWYEREEFGWIADFEAATPALKAELLNVLADGRDFDPYVAGSSDRPLPNNPLLNDPSWGAFYFWKDGVPVEASAARCPATMEALAKAPMPVIAGRSPMALYSLLKPGTHIEAHHGMLNTRLICHLPLIAPEGCLFRVGAETRPWEEGRMLIFDDSFEHEAWNNSPNTRVVLLFEIWRPEINAEERAALVRLFEAIDIRPSGDGPDA